MEINETTQTEPCETNLTEISKSFLKEIGKWSHFLSIIGFIMIGFMALGSLFAGTIIGANPAARMIPGLTGGIITTVYLLMAVLYFFPVYYLFNFSKNIKKGFSENNSKILEEAFKNLKSHYKFLGILMIVMLSLYAFFAVIGIIVAIASSIM